MELCTGRITVEEIEDEVQEIARILTAAELHAVLLTYGGGCKRRGSIEDDIDIPIATSLLPGFIEQSEDDGVYQMGRTDLFFKTDDGRVSFLLCAMSDIHCYTEDTELFEFFVQRWAILYPGASELSKDKPGLQRLLSGDDWSPFTQPSWECDEDSTELR